MFSASFKMFARGGAVEAAPTISAQPSVTSGAGMFTSTTILKKATAVSSVISLTASGSSLTYQWYKNGSSFVGQTSTSFTLSGGSGGTDAASDAAFYYCIVSNSGGSVTSSTLALSCLFSESGAQNYAFAAGLSSIAVKVWGSGGRSTPADDEHELAGGTGGGSGYAYGIFSFSSFTVSNQLQMRIGGASASTAFYTSLESSVLAAIVAGGGGGASETNGTDPGQAGGAGGDTVGLRPTGYSQTAGYGGTASAGGAAGTGSTGTGIAGTGPSYIGATNGGTGGTTGTGGSGYFGGGSGGSDFWPGGGGGGSGVLNSVTSGTMSTGSNNVPGNFSDAQRFTKAGYAGDSSNMVGYSGCVVITPNAL